MRTYQHRTTKPVQSNCQITLKTEIDFDAFCKLNERYVIKFPLLHCEAVWEYYQNREMDFGIPLTIESDEMASWHFTQTLVEYLPTDSLWHCTKANPLGLAPATETEAFAILAEFHESQKEIAIILLPEGGYLIRE